MNVPLLRKIQEQIKAEPDSLDMRNFHSYCGTAHCIAGLAQVLAGKNPDSDRTFEEASGVLELSYDQAMQLFFVHFWPSKFLNAKYREVACDRIDHFITTGGD